VDRFIVGTGRCGSTLLSRMLAQHTRVLSLFELFNGIDAERRFSEKPLAGVEFGALISAEQPFVTAVLRRGYDVPEIVYPFGPGARYRRDEPLPWILVSLLPRLTDDPDALFGELTAFVARQPRQPPVRHYRTLFEWLGERLGRPLWIERSGSSIEYLGALHARFPDARFLHLHRDGREVALSMREHHAYRLPISILYGAPVDGVPLAELGPIDVYARPTGRDPISRLLASRPPAAYFGRYWNDQILRGLRAGGRIDAEQILTVRFEDLVARPADVLREIGRFFELDPDDGWVGRAAALVRGRPEARYPSLPEPARRALGEACRPGQVLLGRTA
jgi:hypothetical protein